MKKIIISIVALLGICLASSAQDSSFNKSLSLSFGGASGLQSEGFFSATDDPYTLSGIYEPTYSYHSYMPTWSLDGDYIFGRWFGASLSLSWSAMYAQKLDGVNRNIIGDCSVNALYLVPGVKVYWTNRERFKFYSGLDAGAVGYFINDDDDSRFKLAPCLDIVPVGLRFKYVDGFGLFSFAELIMGNRMIGGRFGIGFAF